MSASRWGAVVFLGVLCSGIAYLFWYSALDRIPASQAGALLYIEPPVAALTAALKSDAAPSRSGVGPHSH